MNKVIKKKWVKALKSGNYKQGFKALRPTENTFCCLGVLCDIYAKEKGAKWHRNKKAYIYYSIDGDTMDLPKSVLLWAGFKLNSLSFAYAGEEMHLADCNDVERLDLNTIADLIQDQL